MHSSGPYVPSLQTCTGWPHLRHRDQSGAPVFDLSLQMVHQASLDFRLQRLQAYGFSVVGPTLPSVLTSSSGLVIYIYCLLCVHHSVISDAHARLVLPITRDSPNLARCDWCCESSSKQIWRTQGDFHKIMEIFMTLNLCTYFIVIITEYDCV